MIFHISDCGEKMNDIEERKSIRKYKQDTVAKSDIDKIIKVDMLAPSAKNRQPWKYIVYGKESKESLLNEMKNISQDQEKILIWLLNTANFPLSG